MVRIDSSNILRKLDILRMLDNFDSQHFRGGGGLSMLMMP